MNGFCIPARFLFMGFRAFFTYMLMIQVVTKHEPRSFVEEIVLPNEKYR